jgi:acyl-homoserine-lactone acylase
MDGMPEALRATYTNYIDKGLMKIHTGDTFVGFAQFDENGLVNYETIVPYGSSSRKDSPHYTDQMEMYTKHQMKTMSLKREAIMQKAERTYTVPSPVE